MYPPLKIPPAAQRAHNVELLQRLLAHRGPVTLPHLFEGLSPRWAVDALDRLLIAGDVVERPDGTLVVIDRDRVAKDLARRGETDVAKYEVARRVAELEAGRFRFRPRAAG